MPTIGGGKGLKMMKRKCFDTKVINICLLICIFGKLKNKVSALKAPQKKNTKN